MARCSGACGSRQVQSSFTSRNQKHTNTSYTAPKPVKQRALPQQQEVVLEGYTVSYQAYNAFLTGPLNMLLVRAAVEHAAEKAKERPLWANTPAGGECVQQQAQHAAAAAAHTPASSTSAEQYHDCHEEFYYDCEEELTKPSDISSECYKECQQACSVLTNEMFDSCCVDDADVDAFVYVTVASCMSDCSSC